MEYRPLEITLASAKDLKDVNLITKMDVYAVVAIKGDIYSTNQKQKTHVDKDCGPNPKWNHAMKFDINEVSLQQNGLILKFELFSQRSLGDKEIGEVHVPIKELYDGWNSEEKFDNKEVSYSVRTTSGKGKGTLNFSYKFGDKMEKSFADKAKKVEEPIMAYPIQGGTSSANPAPDFPRPGYPQPAYPYPQPGGYPPAYQQAGYPPAPMPGYGYPGYPPQQYYGGYMQPHQKPKKNKGNLALGLGAGLLGGLLVGDMMADVGEMAAYDDGFGF